MPSRKKPDIRVEETTPVSVPSNKIPPTAKKSEKSLKWKKPKDKPKRPLSARNIFFARKRQDMIQRGTLQTASSSDSDSIAVAAKWTSLSPSTRFQYVVQAEIEQGRYEKELQNWEHLQVDRKRRQDHLDIRNNLSAHKSITRLPAPRNYSPTKFLVYRDMAMLPRNSFRRRSLNLMLPSNLESKGVAAPDRINNLAAQLDGESFDFLSSLKNVILEEGGS
jgi:hypothetical protein